MNLKLRFLLSMVFALAFLSCGKSNAGNTDNNTPKVVVDTVAIDTIQTVSVDTITVAMTGDVNFGTNYPARKLPVNGGKNLFDHAGALIANADVAAGNLEGVLSDNAKPRGKTPGKYTFFFRSPASDAKFLADAGYDFMGMANNHANDFTTEGITHTKSALDKYGIGHAGSVGDEYSIKTINGVKYGFVAFGHSSATLHTYDTATVKRIITTVRPLVDILIVSFHGGAEGVSHRHLPYGNETYVGDFRGDSRTFSHLCIDLGADVVFGHGPHVVRCMELYKGHLIAYSLGNFCTPGGMNVSGKTGYAPLLVVNLNKETGEFIDGKIHSFIQKWGAGPQPDAQNLVPAEIRTLTQSDIKEQLLDIADDGTLTPRKK